jgi:hypothetical protein
MDEVWKFLPTPCPQIGQKPSRDPSRLSGGVGSDDSPNNLPVGTATRIDESFVIGILADIGPPCQKSLFLESKI